MTTPAPSSPPFPARTIRADARRNRERLLAAAKTVFARGGPTPSLDAVAREAHLGIGTLYRHFPTREALYEAVYRRDVEQLVDHGTALLDADDPVAGLRQWLHAMIDVVATKKGMIAAFALAADTTSAISARTTGPLAQMIDRLVARAIAAGHIGTDVTGGDLLLGVVGMCMLRDQPGWQAGVARLIDALIDGLTSEPKGGQINIPAGTESR